MATFSLICSGPGPHVPASGILGTSSVQDQGGMRCSSAACAKVADPRVTNADTLRSRAAIALTTNANYLAIAAPSNIQVAAQVRALTKETNALIRLLLGLLADVSDTA